MAQDAPPQRTPGQTIVDVDFAATDEISQIKQEFAALIDKVFEIPSRPNTFRHACQMETVRNLETAAMYAVKTITRPL